MGTKEKLQVSVSRAAKNTSISYHKKFAQLLHNYSVKLEAKSTKTLIHTINGNYAG